MKAFLIGLGLCAVIAAGAFFIAPCIDWPSGSVFSSDTTRL